MKKIFIFILLSTILCAEGTAQALISDVLDPSNSSPNLVYLEDSKEIEGSPFLFDEWKTGKVVSFTDHTFEKLEIKYHLYADEVLVKTERMKGSILVKKDKIARFVIQDGEKERVFVNLSNGVKNGYFEVLEQGNEVLLLKKHQAEFKKAKQNNGYGASYQTKDRFVTKSDLFLYSDDTKKLVDINKKLDEHTLKLIFKEKHADEMIQYVKQYKLKGNAEVDLIKLLYYYKSIN